MHHAPQIRVERTDYGPFAQAPRLNPRLSARKPLLLTTLDIRWQTQDPAADLARLENSLLEFSPRFGRHECRGERAYHVFQGEVGGHARPPQRDKRSPAHDRAYEGHLALAHLIEHAVIDFMCTITGERRCSGVTAAYRDRDDRFDLMVECPDPRAGRCSLALALVWLTSALDGRKLGPEEKEILAAARQVYSGPLQGWTAPVLARELGVPEKHASRALAALKECGFLRELPWTMNLSGVPEYHLRDN